MLSNRLLTQDFSNSREAVFPLLTAVDLVTFRRGDGVEQTLADAVKLLCDKLLDLTELCWINDLKLNQVLTHSHVTHKQWSADMIQVFEKLRLWE